MFRRRSTRGGFAVRETARDVETDIVRAKRILDAIETAIKETNLEKSGLQRRLSEVLARASVTVGNAVDEYMTRDSVSEAHQSHLSAEIRYAENRLKRLEDSLECYISFCSLANSVLRSNPSDV